MAKHGISRHYALLGVSCGEWTYLFATNVANVKILLDITGLNVSDVIYELNYPEPEVDKF